MAADDVAAVLHPEFSMIVSGVKGAEGPVFSPSGELYLVAPEVEIEGKPAGQVLRVDLVSKKTSLLCAPVSHGHGGIPAGCQFHRDGTLWVADMRLGILKVHPDSGLYFQVKMTDGDGRGLQGCNDCSFDYLGNLWVTAPAGDIAPAEYRRSMEEPFGSVYCLTAGGVLRRVFTGIRFPNGIAVQHDGTGRPNLLIVAETPTKTLWAFPIIDAAQLDLEARFQWGQLPGDHEGGPDGMDFDSDGNLLVANWGAAHIEVFPPSGGKPCCRVACPFSRPSNVHFRPGTKEVYVTEHDNHALWTFAWLHVGRPQFCERS